MSYPAYTVLHLIGVFLVLMSIGVLVAQEASAQSRAQRWRTLGTVTHGVGLLLLLITGLGLLARVGQSGSWPGWLTGKFLIWIALGAVILIARRYPGWGLHLWWSTFLLVVLATYLAKFKPF